jgi:hypothetical protein
VSEGTLGGAYEERRKYQPQRCGKKFQTGSKIRRLADKKKRVGLCPRAFSFAGLPVERR